MIDFKVLFSYCYKLGTQRIQIYLGKNDLISLDISSNYDWKGNRFCIRQENNKIHISDIRFWFDNKKGNLDPNWKCDEIIIDEKTFTTENELYLFFEDLLKQIEELKLSLMGSTEIPNE